MTSAMNFSDAFVQVDNGSMETGWGVHLSIADGRASLPGWLFTQAFTHWKGENV